MGFAGAIRTADDPSPLGTFRPKGQQQVFDDAHMLRERYIIYDFLFIV